MEAEKAKKKVKRWLLIPVALAAVSLMTAGVFAATQITINGGQAVNLGAGTAAVNVCGSTATVSATQYFNSTQQAFYTSTVSITGVPSTCAGKILSLAFKGGITTSTINTATWAVPSNANGSETYVYGYGSTGGSCAQGGTCQAQTALQQFDTAASGLTTIAVAAQ